MDKNELKRRIQEVAIIKDLKPVTSPTIRLDDTHQNDVRVGNDWVHIDKDSNPTLGYKFIKLKEQHRVCEMGCGKVVTDQVIEKRMAFTPEKHWRTRCNACGMYLSPDGQGFIDGGHAAAAAYVKHFNKLKGVETPEKEIKSNSETNQEYSETVKNNTIIRVYK